MSGLMLDKVLLGKLVLSLCLTFFAAMGYLLLTRKNSDRFSSSSLKLCSLFLGIRFTIFFFIFVVFRLDAQSDVMYYYRWAAAVSQWHSSGESQEIVDLHYGPLFLPLMGLLLRIWNDPKVLILSSILAEFALFIVWVSLGQRISSSLTMKQAAILYTFCPVSVIGTAVDGNNDVLSGMFVSLFVALTLFNKPGLSGIVAGISVVASKALITFAGLPVFLASERKALWLSMVAVPIVLGYGIWLMLPSIDVISGFRFHAMHYSSGNLPFWISLFGPDLMSPPGRWVVNGIVPVVILVIALLPLYAYRSFNHKDIVPITGAITMAFMILSAKSFPHYVLVALFPILVIVAEMPLRSSLVLYVLFSVMTSIESSFWFRVFEHGSPGTIREMVPSNWIPVLAFGTIESCLLVTYGIILWRCIHAYVRVTRPVLI
jgi:hypothetical protein